MLHPLSQLHPQLHPHILTLNFGGLMWDPCETLVDSTKNKGQDVMGMIGGVIKGVNLAFLIYMYKKHLGIW